MALGSSRVSELIRVRVRSDGDPNHRPEGTEYERTPVDLYLQKLGTKWLQEIGGIIDPVRTYALDKLPDGYVLYERKRPIRSKDSHTHTDRYLFGHPSHRVFESPNRFYPHFRYLMRRDNYHEVCSCHLCQKTKKAQTRQSSVKKAGGIRARPPLAARPTDDEGLPLSLSILFDLLQKENRLERLIQENQSMDWRAERKAVPEVLEQMSKQYSFIPRVGELVLWCRSIEGQLRHHPQTGELMLFDPKSNIYAGYPLWMGGVVTQTPIPSQPVVFGDILKETKKQHAVNSSGFRIECYPDPNSSQKDLSKQYSYVPLHHIRPISLWRETLTGVPESMWHPTIRNCLTAMSTFSLIERYRFKGMWPNANVYAKGCYLGSEALFVGDIVRLALKGESGSNITDILQITDIVLKFSNVQLDEKGQFSGDNTHINMVVHGYAYTSDITRSNRRISVDQATLPSKISSRLSDYGKFYHADDPGTVVSVDISTILGRLFEHKAMQQWLPTHSAIPAASLLSPGYPGIFEARAFARSHDSRLQAGVPILLSDTRTDALDLSSFNGVDCGKHNKDRNPKAWRDLLTVIDGVRGTSAIQPPVSSTPSRGAKLVMVAIPSPDKARLKSDTAASRIETPNRTDVVEISSSDGGGTSSSSDDKDEASSKQLTGSISANRNRIRNKDNELASPERKKLKVAS